MVECPHSIFHNFAMVPVYYGFLVQKVGIFTPKNAKKGYFRLINFSLKIFFTLFRFVPEQIFSSEENEDETRSSGSGSGLSIEQFLK